jgi:hypothetical protein
MTKFLFSCLLLAHGTIHLIGFAKAFGYGHFTQIVRPISKPIGSIWLVCTILFCTITILFITKKEYWSMAAIIAAIVSQLLIFNLWKDAKFGSIANIIILIVAIPAYAKSKFNHRVEKEITKLISEKKNSPTIIQQSMIEDLPPIVKKWLIKSHIIGKEKIQFVRLKQNGEMRTKFDSKWMAFSATQYFNVNTPSFIWQTEVQVMPLINMVGRDKFENGEGEMEIKILSLFKIVDEGKTKQMNESTMLRFLAETVWFPSAAINEYIKWDSINETSARITMKYKGLQVSGLMQFNNAGDVLSFEAMRFYKSTMEIWRIECYDYKTFEGIRIPNKSNVIWKLEDGDFNWLKLEIADLNYNINSIYKTP